jgi:hypothetical protein
VLEAFAWKEALPLASDLQLARIKVAADCLEAINSVESSYLGKLSTITQEIKLRGRDFASATFVHE